MLTFANTLSSRATTWRLLLLLSHIIILTSQMPVRLGVPDFVKVEDGLDATIVVLLTLVNERARAAVLIPFLNQF